MEDLETQKDILTQRIKVMKRSLKDYYFILDSYKTLKNSIYISSGYQQSNRINAIAKKISELTIKIEEREIAIAQLDQELNLIEILIFRKNK